MRLKSIDNRDLSAYGRAFMCPIDREKFPDQNPF